VFRPRLAALDGLRLVAALAVAGFHYTTAWRLDGHNLPQYFLPHAVHFFVYGFLGVELFFLISGFVICMSSWGRTLGDFFTSRVSRLYPAYWVAVLISSAVAICWPVKGAALGDRPGGVQILVNLTMLQQPLGVSGVDGVYWTLFTELRFYLLMALLLRKGLTYRKTVVFCCVWMTLSVLGPSLFNVQINTLLITDYSPYFIAGIAMYLMRRFGATPLLFGIAGLAWLVSLSRVEDRVHLMNSGFPVPVWPALRGDAGRRPGRRRPDHLALAADRRRAHLPVLPAPPAARLHHHPGPLPAHGRTGVAADHRHRQPPARARLVGAPPAGTAGHRVAQAGDAPRPGGDGPRRAAAVTPAAAARRPGAAGDHPAPPRPAVDAPVRCIHALGRFVSGWPAGHRR
jgi:hypothetical protein